MTRLSGLQESFYYYYFLFHIPITLLIDSSVVVPPDYHPASKLVEWHIKQNNDFLLWEKPTWLYWFVVVELVVQLPLFVYFVYGFRSIWASEKRRLNKERKVETADARKSLYRWLRIYGLNASFTTFICIITIYHRGYYPSLPLISMSQQDKIRLILVYLPTFLIPLRLCFL